MRGASDARLDALDASIPMLDAHPSQGWAATRFHCLAATACLALAGALSVYVMFADAGPFRYDVIALYMLGALFMHAGTDRLSEALLLGRGSRAAALDAPSPPSVRTSMRTATFSRDVAIASACMIVGAIAGALVMLRLPSEAWPALLMLGAVFGACVIAYCAAAATHRRLASDAIAVMVVGGLIPFGAGLVIALRWTALPTLMVLPLTMLVVARRIGTHVRVAEPGVADGRALRGAIALLIVSAYLAAFGQYAVGLSFSLLAALSLPYAIAAIRRLVRAPQSPADAFALQRALGPLATSFAALTVLAFALTAVLAPR